MLRHRQESDSGKSNERDKQHCVATLVMLLVLDILFVAHDAGEVEEFVYLDGTRTI